MNKKIKRVVIIGSDSFIASSVIPLLKKKNINTLLINRKVCDLLEEDSSKILSRKIKNDDIIIFAAANAPVKNYNMFLDNIKICKNIINSLHNKYVRMVYISSDAVYSDKKTFIDENSKTDPDSLHGLMHITREKLLSTIKFKSLTIIRPTLVYGSNDPHNGYGPNKFMRLAALNKNIELYGYGEELRDHIFINDLGKIIFNCIIKNKAGVFNAVSGRVISFKTIAQNIIKYKKSNSKIIYIKRVSPMPHNGYRAFNNQKIKKDLNITFKSFKEIIKNQF